MKQLGVADLKEVMDAAKVPFRTMAYTPGAPDEIPFDGAMVKVTGSVVPKIDDNLSVGISRLHSSTGF